MIVNISLTMLILIYIAIGLCTPAIAQDTARIAGFQALFFNSKSGTLSKDMLAEGAPEMGNVPSGEFASVSTFIVVEVELGEEAAIPKNARVRLVARESGLMPYAVKHKKESDRIILDRTSHLGPVNSEGKTYMGFWLASTGCKVVSLKASLIGMKGELSLTRELPFTCYE